jgi:hypothetical protein
LIMNMNMIPKRMSQGKSGFPEQGALFRLSFKREHLLRCYLSRHAL